MKNIHILPTDKPSRLFKLAGDLHLHEEREIDPKRNQNIYITSDEEIKEGDWCYNIDADIWAKCKIPLGYKDYKKIILTTDVDLIKDGVQAIDEFLEWFVNNPSCEEVEIVKQKVILGRVDGTTYVDFNYKIIIPKEEAKQETLEEAAEKYDSQYINRLRPAFIAGAKWQQERMYSEEEVRKMLEDAVHESRMQDDKSEDYIVNETIFEFKKK